MITGYYSGLSGIYYNEQKLDVVANNISNANTPGFRRSLLMLQAREQNREMGQMDPAVASRVPAEYGVERMGVYKDYDDTGRLEATNNPMDIAIPTELRNAFFAVQRAGAPDGAQSFTRNGTLSLGRLDPQNPNSPSVLRISGHLALNANGQPIDVDPTRGALTITAEGTIVQGNETVGELPIYRLNKSADPTSQEDANLQALEQRGDSLFEVPQEYSSQFNPVRIRVGQNGVSRVLAQGMRESSNVNVFQEMTEMINVSRSAQANRNAMNFQMDGLTKLFQTIRS